jgi:hypothetical protein
VWGKPGRWPICLSVGRGSGPAQSVDDGPIRGRHVVSLAVSPGYSGMVRRRRASGRSHLACRPRSLWGVRFRRLGSELPVPMGDHPLPGLPEAGLSWPRSRCRRRPGSLRPAAVRPVGLAAAVDARGGTSSSRMWSCGPRVTMISWARRPARSAKRARPGSSRSGSRERGHQPPSTAPGA